MEIGLKHTATLKNFEPHNVQVVHVYIGDYLSIGL